MKTEYKYINFVEIQTAPTAIWACRNRKQKGNLGQVEWYGLWRRWIFVPGDGTVFSSDCLTDIADFMNQLKPV